MFTGFKALRAVALYTPDPSRAVELYRGLGLEPHPGGREQAEAEPAVTRLLLRFPEGSCELVLHGDPQRQFVELQVEVGDVLATYARLARVPNWTWVETPSETARGWRAVMAFPDGNVFTLLDSAPTPFSSRAEGATGASGLHSKDSPVRR